MELQPPGDLQKWRSLRDYLQMYERVTQPGTEAHMYMNPSMPWATGPGGRPVIGKPEGVAEVSAEWKARKQGPKGTPNHFMVYPRWSPSQKRFVITPSRIPYGTSAYPLSQIGEGGIFRLHDARGLGAGGKRPRY